LENHGRKGRAFPHSTAAKPRMFDSMELAAKVAERCVIVSLTEYLRGWRGSLVFFSSNLYTRSSFRPERKRKQMEPLKRAVASLCGYPETPKLITRRGFRKSILEELVFSRDDPFGRHLPFPVKSMPPPFLVDLRQRVIRDRIFGIVHSLIDRRYRHRLIGGKTDRATICYTHERR
jgi:hypothetical protein